MAPSPGIPTPPSQQGTPAPEASTAAPTAPPAPTNITFIENELARARGDARARHVPLFIDTWATWCHTCLSMRSYVFPDPALRPFAGRFVWLSVDTEREENAPLVTKLGIRVLPTLFVVDATTEKPVLAWPGSLTATELAQLLPDAELATHPDEAGSDASRALLRGHQASAAGDDGEAITAYRTALAEAPPGWARRAQAVDGLVTRLGQAKQLAACVTVGADEAPKLPPGTALADVLRAAMGCADDHPPKAPERRRLADLTSLGERVAMDRAQPILADDRSDLFDYVVHALRSLPHRPAQETARVARAWATFLEGEAAHAPDPAARAVFDAHRLLAYEALGAPERAVPMLQQSERDFPDDSNPPARHASAFLQMKHYDEALAALRRALGRAYGPRKLRLWSLQADICEARKDRAGARQALAEALEFAKTVQLTGGYPKLKDALEKRLEKLGAGK